MHDSPLSLVAESIILLSVILICAKLFGELTFRFLKLPRVIGELGAGIIIGPFALGGLIWGNLGPLFPIEHNSVIPVNQSLYFLANIGAVILLFEAGLETNKKRFFNNIGPASFIALGGVIFPFFLGLFCTVLFGFSSFDSIQDLVPGLFVGAMMTATSVGITARVLGDLNKLNSPEGVTILGGAVVDDVLGLLILALIVGIETTGVLSGVGVLIIFVKAIAFLLVVSIAGSWASPWISTLIMRLGTKEGFYSEPSIHLCLSLALVFLISGLAEKYFGLAMIIGSYSLGLALSGTPLFKEIRSPIHRLNGIVVPIFFTVIGMQVNLQAIFGGNSIVNAVLFAIVLSILGIISKLAGCGLPALLVGFNRSESWKIGVGMIPRGEVALIIGGIALASGVISQQIFGVTVIMTLVTTIIAPIMLVRSYR
jgi:Kef-type K+ transport system membrane component KefB